jgi:uncharacterized coiled-coil DUF342 family protein
MPPAPTELMAVDLKRLEDSYQRIAARIDGLEAGVQDFREESAGFRGRVDTYFGFMKWLGVFFAGILVAVVAGTGRVVWDASAVSTSMKQQVIQFDEMRSEVKQQGKRLDGVEKRLDGVEKKLEQQGTRLDGIEKRLDGVEKRLDQMGKQLEILIRRGEPKAGG